DVFPDRRLEEQRLQRRRVMKSQCAECGKCAQFWRQLRVHAALDDEYTRVDEVLLPLILISTEIRQEADRTDQAGGCLCQTQALSIPETEWSSREDRRVEH